MQYIIRSDDAFKILELENEINPVDKVFDFIIENYPVQEYPKILEIAAGNGEFSKCLAEYGYQVTAMDLKLNLNKNTKYKTVVGTFSDDTDITGYDLGIVIHPCGIHKEIIKNFEINKKAMFLMPCYKMTCDSHEFDLYDNNDEWLKNLEMLNPKMKKKDFFKDYCYDLCLDTFLNAFYIK